ncbi:hypothetical protein D3Z74_19760 [Vibrio cholerae]|nr:hypothetical protein [Vibrio cholerae]
MIFLRETNARLRGWQRIPLNSNTTNVTAAAQWDWKRYALTVPLEAFVMLRSYQRLRKLSHVARIVCSFRITTSLSIIFDIR